MKHLLIMAAGTGGHIFPGLAIAKTMQEKGWSVSWLGTQQGMERDIVPKHGIPLDMVDFSGLRGKGLTHTLKGCLKMAESLNTCRQVIAARKPDVVLGMGGYVTVPGGLVARAKGVPLALVNADAALLLSNRVLSPFASKVMFGLPADFGAASNKAIVTGNPVRSDIAALPAPRARFEGRSGPLRILVLGGSLGAKALNEVLPLALAQIPAHLRPHITHQSGKKHIEALRQAYAQAGVVANSVDFIDDMSAQYADADLVICRAGAITVAELTAAGVASILVPLVVSTTSHQRDNAVWLEQQKGAFHLPQSELTPGHLSALLQSLTRPMCLSMAESAYAAGKRDANSAIASALESLAESSGPRYRYASI